MIKNLKDIDPMSDTRTSFIIVQAEKEHDLVCAEIGVWVGKNAETMLKLDPTMKLHLIDAYSNVGVTDDYSEGKPEEVKEKARLRLEPFKDRTTFVYKQSEVAYLDYPDEYFDYIYIDGDHSFYGAYQDMRVWWSKLKKGGVMGGHDYTMTSVSKAVIEFGADHQLLGRIYKIEGDGKSDWWVVK